MFGHKNKKDLPDEALAKTGFTFLELVIVLAIIAILATFIVPNFKRLWPGYQKKQFIDYMNALMQITWHNAIVTGKLHRINFDLEKRKVWVEQQSNKKELTATKEIPFVPMNSPYMKTTYEWPVDTFNFRNFYIAKRDEIALTLRGKEGKIWFYITPEGLAQPVILNIFDLKEVPLGQQGNEFSLVLNPFSVQFKEYDTFQKPE